MLRYRDKQRRYKLGMCLDRRPQNFAQLTENRFLYTKILLFRPVLRALLSSRGDPATNLSSTESMNMALQHSMINQISRRCVLAAHDLLDLVYENMLAGDLALPAW